MAKDAIVVDPAEELVDVYIPKRNKGDTERFISVNGSNILVKTGVPVKIKRMFAEVLWNSETMEAEAEKFIEANCSR